MIIIYSFIYLPLLKNINLAFCSHVEVYSSVGDKNIHLLIYVSKQKNNHHYFFDIP